MRKLIVLLLLTGCSFYSPRRQQYRSNLVEYLYPNGMSSRPQPARLQLPLKIGIAFVPSPSRALDPRTEERLLGIVKHAFAGRDWVGHIETIPSSYLVQRGGFGNLEQVAHLMNVDVVALVSVDQIQYRDPTMLSILYVSIIGEYLLPGDRNDTRTLIDVAAIDVDSRAFLLRAPGASRIGGMSTPATADRALRNESDEGLRLAMLDLTKNLDSEVGAFKTSVATHERADVDIVTRSGASISAGGAIDPVSLVLIMIVVAAAFVPMRRTR